MKHTTIPTTCGAQEMGSADPEDSGAESIPVWPDTDDEEQMSMNFETYRKNTEQSFQSLQSTLEGPLVAGCCSEVVDLNGDGNKKWESQNGHTSPGMSVIGQYSHEIFV